MSSISSLIIPFLIGGTVIASVKYASSHIKNPGVAAIIGGIPTGLLAIYFIAEDETMGYTHNYFFVTLSLLVSIAVFYIINKHTELKKDIILLISLLCWATLVGISYMLEKNKS